MTVLSACQEAAVEIGQPNPTAVYGAAAPFARELALQANRVAQEIAKAHDWRALTTLGTLTGDGSTTSFALPADYDRMLKKTQVHSHSWQNMGFSSPRDLDQWLNMNDSGVTGTPGNWVLLGGRFQFTPAMPTGETARFYYQSKYYALATDNTTTKPAFTIDTDMFRLSERVLALGIVYRWRVMKGYDASAASSQFAVALAEEIGADKGSRSLAIGRKRLNAELAYQGILGGPGAPNWATNTPPMTFDEE